MDRPQTYCGKSMLGFGNVCTEPDELMALLERIDNGTASGYDRFLAGIMKDRIERFNGDDPGLKRLKEILSKV